MNATTPEGPAVDPIDKTAALDLAYGGLLRRDQVAYMTIGMHPTGMVSTTAVAAALETSAREADIALVNLSAAGLIKHAGVQNEWIASEQVRTHAAACAENDLTRDSCNYTVAQLIADHLLDYYRLAMNAVNHRLMPHRPILRTRFDTRRALPVPTFDSADAARSWLSRHWETLQEFQRRASAQHPLMGMQYIDGMTVNRALLGRTEGLMTMVAEADAAGRVAIEEGDYDAALVCTATAEDLAHLVGDYTAVASALGARATVHQLRRDYAVAARLYSQEQEILTNLRGAPADQGHDRTRSLALSLIESAFVRNELGTWWMAVADAQRAVTLLMNLPHGDGVDLARARVELVAASVSGVDASQRGELIRLVVRINRVLRDVDQMDVSRVAQRAYRVAAAVAERIPVSLAGRLPTALHAEADKHGARVEQAFDQPPSPQTIARDAPAVASLGSTASTTRSKAQRRPRVAAQRSASGQHPPLHQRQ